jgi:hypothetical protein
LIFLILRTWGRTGGYRLALICPGFKASMTAFSG